MELIFFRKLAKVHITTALCVFSCLMIGTALAQSKQDQEDAVVTLRLPVAVADTMERVLDGRIADAAYEKGRKLAEKESAGYDPLAAEKLLLQAAEFGHIDAQYELARLYGSGDVSGNKKNASALYFKWVRAAAIQGHIKAQYLLYFCYSSGVGTHKDVGAAFYWLKKSAESGHRDAVKQIAASFYHGNTTDKDLRQAYYWYQKLAELGDPWGYFRLALLHEKKQFGQPDRAKALAFYTLGAQGGDASSQGVLGRIYYEGDGVARNLDTALVWYQKALANGMTGAARWINIIENIQHPVVAPPPSEQEASAEDYDALVASLSKTWEERGQEAKEPQAPPSLPVETPPSCNEVLESGYLVCPAVPNSYACASYSCDYNWECYRESRVPIGNGRVRIVKGKDDTRFGQCRPPRRSPSGYDIRYCDPKTGFESDDFKKLANKVCG